MTPKGWVKAPNFKKFHYIQESGRSLCGRWFYPNNDPEAYDDDPTEKQDECSSCRKRLNKMLSKE